MERYELAEWDPKAYHEWYRAKQSFNARVRPKSPEKGKWYAVYPEGPKKGQKMSVFDPKAGCVMYAHKTSKLAKKIELKETAKILGQVPTSLEILPQQFSEAGVEFWTPEITEKLKQAANLIDEVHKVIDKELSPPKVTNTKTTKKKAEKIKT